MKHSFIHSFTHSYIRQIFTERLLCVRHWARHQGFCGDYGKARSSPGGDLVPLHGLTQEARGVGQRL